MMNSVYTILHPTDFSRCADKAFQAACALARDRGAQLVLLHVMEPVRLSGQWITVELFSASKQERWEALHQRRAREPDVRIEPVLRKGTSAAVILALAREVPCDLIVMGMQGHAGQGPSRLGGVAAKVARLAPCPVLSVKVPTAAVAGQPEDEQLVAA
jgi:nucleotide-binding universal stress UspA family protein